MVSLCSLLEWDSAFFGFPIAQVNGRRLTQSAALEIIDWCEQHQVRCLYFLADPTSIETAAAISELNFNMVDVRLELSRKGRQIELMQPAGFELRAARPEDLPVLKAIARDSHQDSRFFFDSHFSVAKSKELFSVWISADYAGRADTVLTISNEGGTGLGYISCKVSPQLDSGSISLFGVATGFRGRGLGKALLAGALGWFAERNAVTISVVTQARNVAAQRLYQTADFCTQEVGIWYHRWF